MQPRYYFDIAIQPGFSGPVMDMLMNTLHLAFARSDRQYAVAWPYAQRGKRRSLGSIVRVFSSSRDALDDLVTCVSSASVVDQYCAIMPIRSVPADFEGDWLEYRRIRVPGRRSAFADARLKRLEEAEKLPHFRVFSRSTGQRFPLFVDVIMHDAAADECRPDGYGLSVATRAFRLPAL